MRRSTWASTLGLWLLASPIAAWAQERTELPESTTTTLEGLGSAGTAAGVADADVSLLGLIGRFINVVLAFSGILLLIMFIYGGIMYLTALGDADKVKKGKATLINAVIGLVIVVSAFAITSFILPQLIFLSTST